MGLIDFVKGAGAKLTGKKEDPTSTEEFQELGYLLEKLDQSLDCSR